MKNRKLNLAVILFVTTHFSIKAQDEFFISLNTYSYSEPTSIDSFINKFDGELKKGDHAVTHNQFEVGGQWQNISLSFIKRFDHFYKFTPDTTRFYYNTENDVKFISPEQLDLHLKVSHLEASGVKLAYQWQYSSELTIGAAFNYLTTQDFYEGEIIGDAEWRGEDDYFVTAPATLYSATNMLLNYPETDAEGKGGAIDINVQWQFSERWQVALLVKDIWSEIKWQDALLSNINRWEVHRLDDNGELDTRPILEGRTLGYTQTLPKKIFSELSYTMNNGLALSAGIFHTRYFSHKNVKVAYPIIKDHYVSAAWHLQTETFELGYQMPYGYFRVMTDSLDERKMYTVALDVGLTIPF